MLPENEENGLLEVAAIPVCGIDKVKFEKIKKKYVCDPANPSYVMAEFILDKDVEHSTRDWIGLFPRGWNSLFQNVAFEYIICQALNEKERRWRIPINLNFVKEDLYHPEFQFVFVSCDLQILGTSHFFRFYKCEADAQAAYRKIYKNEAKPQIQNLEEAQVTGLQEADATRPNRKIMRKRDNLNFQKHDSSPSARSAYSDSALLYNKKSSCFPNCRNCDRMSELIHFQQKLFHEIKNLAEEKRDLEEYITFLKEKLELSLVAQKKLRLVAEYEKRERITVQAIASSVLQQITDNSVMRMNNGNFEVILQPFNQVPFLPQQSQRKTKPTTSSMSSRHLELKAIIGAQNEKIRLKEARIAQLEAALRDAEKPIKVTAIVADLPDKKRNVKRHDLQTDESIDLNNNS